VLYFRADQTPEAPHVTWIFLMMLGMIIGSIIIELVLPMRVKERLGAIICWGMMAVTMTFIALSTVGLIYIIGTKVLGIGA
jgi:hypothetical protein